VLPPSPLSPHVSSRLHTLTVKNKSLISQVIYKIISVSFYDNTSIRTMQMSYNIRYKGENETKPDYHTNLVQLNKNIYGHCV
jgi:hypothetical protein